MKHLPTLVVLALFALAGCDALDGPKSATAPVAAPPAPTLGMGKSADALDKTTDAEKAAALAAPSGGARALGQAVVALGSPAEQGFWVKSPLVAVKAKGHVVTESGASVAVDLLPGSGSAQLSLAAFRALGLDLTDLPEVTIYAD